MRTIIAGSRGITEYRELQRALVACGWRPTVVLSGTARGVDKLGEQWAFANAVPCELYPADWGAHGRRAGMLHNIRMAERAEALIALWDGVSRGTKQMIAVARARTLRARGRSCAGIHLPMGRVRGALVRQGSKMVASLKATARTTLASGGGRAGARAIREACALPPRPFVGAQTKPASERRALPRPMI